MIGTPITELTVGQSAELKRDCVPAHDHEFAEHRDENPLHSDRTFAKRVAFREADCPGHSDGG